MITSKYSRCACCGKKIRLGTSCKIIHIRENSILGEVSGKYDGNKGIIGDTIFNNRQQEKENINSAEAIVNSIYNIYDEAIRIVHIGKDEYIVTFDEFLGLLRENLNTGLTENKDFYNEVLFGKLVYIVENTMSGYSVTNKVNRFKNFNAGLVTEGRMYKLYRSGRYSGDQLLSMYGKKKIYFYWQRILEKPSAKTGLLLYHEKCYADLEAKL